MVQKMLTGEYKLELMEKGDQAIDKMAMKKVTASASRKEALLGGGTKQKV